jgi:predicted amidohydrolase
MPTKVAACQVPDVRENIDASLEWIERFTEQSEEKNVSLVCFPECFLQGYLTGRTISKKACS